MSGLTRSFITVVVGVVGTYVLVAGLVSAGLSLLPEGPIDGVGMLETVPQASAEDHEPEGGAADRDAGAADADGGAAVGATPKAADQVGLRVRIQTPDALVPGRTRQVRLHVEDRPLRAGAASLPPDGQMLAIELSIEPAAGGRTSAWVTPHRLLIPRHELSWTRIRVGVPRGAACGSAAGDLRARVRDIADDGLTDETSVALPSITCRDRPPEAPESVHDTSVVCGGVLEPDPRAQYVGTTTTITPCREARPPEPRPAPRPPEPDRPEEDAEAPDTAADNDEDGGNEHDRDQEEGSDDGADDTDGHGGNGGEGDSPEGGDGDGHGDGDVDDDHGGDGDRQESDGSGSTAASGDEARTGDDGHGGHGGDEGEDDDGTDASGDDHHHADEDDTDDSDHRH